MYNNAGGFFVCLFFICLFVLLLIVGSLGEHFSALHCRDATCTWVISFHIVLVGVHGENG